MFIVVEVLYFLTMGFPGGSVVQSAFSAGGLRSFPGSGRSPREGNGKLSSVLAWRILWSCSLWGCVLVVVIIIVSGIFKSPTMTVEYPFLPSVLLVFLHIF